MKVIANSEVMHLRLPAKLYSYLKVRALDEKRTVQNLTRLLIEKGLEGKD